VLEVLIREKAFPAEGGRMRPIIRDVAFTAAPGEVLVLLGPSGIGKTTVLRITLGLDRRFDGSVRRPPGTAGAVFQEPRLLPWMSVEDNLRLVRPDGLSSLAIGALLEDVRLPGTQHQMPAALSLGMARRVAWARALAVDPTLLVMDEPFASLDAGVVSHLTRMLGRRVKDRGTMVLLSTHDVAQALSIASRVLVIAGTPATLVADVAIPVPHDIAALHQMHRDLVSCFSFLADGKG
jgi:ABC-type nitrate/sulfonate/bicarbonate transport system ATPase subunit